MGETGTLASVWRFVIHIVVGGVMFALILSVAVALAALVKVFQSWGLATDWLVRGCEGVEWAVFWADISLFTLYFLTEAIKFAASLWKELKAAWQK